jgi:N-acetylglucosaminyldiphosphoundecaprenol N-acetyl-beta-D-mannosaminyltransferase
MNSLDLLDRESLGSAYISEHVEVADASQMSIVRDAAKAFVEARDSGTATIATALHIGGLNSIYNASIHNSEFVSALKRARLVYADGIAAVLLAKIAGAAHIERAATTDIGVPVIGAIGELLERPVRLALLGGRPGLAEEAGANLARTTSSEVVYAVHGYKEPDDWDSALAELRAAKPDIVLIGLGSPRELIFSDARLASFPPALLMTCGGWFGFLAGHEPRAPKLLRATGLEWVGRLLHDPRRLGARYFRGGAVFFAMSLRLIGRRMGIGQ